MTSDLQASGTIFYHEKAFVVSEVKLSTINMVVKDHGLLTTDVG
jgi:hypothetical protein